jgi:ABC-type Fe3+/spermidine/putrescine transport system ATPase subunit
MDQPKHAIVAEGLTKSFPGVRAVDALSFDVGAGEIFGLVGPDGAGKTTALRMLAGIMPPDAGGLQLQVLMWFTILRAPSTLSVICRSDLVSMKT